jgi:hypothetical protein
MGISKVNFWVQALLKGKVCMRYTFIWLSSVVLLTGSIVGCKGADKERFVEWQEQHNTALSTANANLATADARLATIMSPPPQVPAARQNIKQAREEIATATEVSSKAAQAVTEVVAEKERIEDSWLSPKQKVQLVGLGVTVALVGLAIALLRWGSLGGKLAAIPVLGMILGRITGRERQPGYLAGRSSE